MRARKNSDLWKRAAIGLAAGAAGTAAMNSYWRILTRLVHRDPRQKMAKSSGPLVDIAIVKPVMREDEASTEAVGRVAYAALTHREPTEQVKHRLSNLVHWSYGMSQGAMYSAARPHPARAADLAGGAAFGVALWAVSILVLPLLGLGKGPTAYAPTNHASTLGAHLVYGATTAATAHLLRRAL